MNSFDVVIVGARCAGSALAVFLARRGLRVCVLDRATFPQDTPSTHVIQPVGVQILDELGVLPSIDRTQAALLDRFTLVNDDVRMDGAIGAPQFAFPGLCIRRLVLDPILQDAASSAGAEVRTGCRVTGVIAEDGRVAGVDTDAGLVRARLTVGADGRNSTIADAVSAAEYLKTPPGRIPAWAYFRGVEDCEGRLRLGQQGDLGFLASPTDSGLYMAGVAIDADKQANFHRDRKQNFNRSLARWPELADLLAGAHREGPIRVMTKWHGYFRQSAGPGWVLVGDAGHFKDFTPAQGISDAFRQAKQLAAAIETGFGATNLDGSTRQWWMWRDDDAYEMYWLAADMGVPGASTPLMTRLLRDLSKDPDAIEKFLRVLNHELSPRHLFTPSRLIAAAGRSLRDRPDYIWPTMREVGATIHAQLSRVIQQRRTRGEISRRRITSNPHGEHLRAR